MKPIDVLSHGNAAMMSLWKVLSTIFDACREIVDLKPTEVWVFPTYPHQPEGSGFSSLEADQWISFFWMLMPEVLDKRAPSLCLTLSDCGHLKKPHPPLTNFTASPRCATAAARAFAPICSFRVHETMGHEWTKMAEPYPAKLCQDLAYTLTSHLHTLSTKQFLSW